MKYVRLALCLACTLLVSRLGFGLEVTPPAGSAVSVKLADAIDSDQETSGKQYQAVLTAPIALPDGQTIPAGSRATVSLLRNNSGWITQLTSIAINNRTFAVSSSAGAIVVPGQKNKPDASAALLSRAGFAPDSPKPARLQLPASTQLRFFLIGTATPARPSPDARHRLAAPSSRGSAPQAASPAAAVSHTSAPQASGIAYLCRATDPSDRLPAPYYVADVQKTHDKPALVEKSWYEYLAATYPYRFANNHHVVVQCTRLSDAAAERDARRTLEGDTGVVHTPWRYRLGTPPAPSASTDAPATPATQVSR